MAKCSKPYMDLVVTQSGLTPEKPWVKVLGINLPSIFEYEEWYNLAQELSDEAWRHYVALGDIESRSSGGAHHPNWNRLRDGANTMWAERSELPTPILSGFDPTEIGWKEDINAAVKVSVDAACLMEKVDDAIREYGVPVPEVGVTPKVPAQKPDKDGIGVLGMIGVLALAGAGVYGVIRYTRKDEVQ